MNVLRVMVMSLGLALCGCSQQDAPPAADVKNPAKAATVESARFMELMQHDRIAVVHQIALKEYALQSRLLEFSGVTDELGGKQRADAALRDLMRAVEASGTPPEIARWTRIADSDQVSGTFSVSQAAVELTAVALDFKSSYGEGAANKSGYRGEAGSAEMNVADGTISYTSSKEVSASGLNGKFATRMKVNVCPDAAGEIKLEIEGKASLSSANNGRGANTEFKVMVTRTLDDDANMSGIDFHANLQSAEFGGGVGSFVDMDSDLSVRAIGNQVNRRSSKTTDADVATVGALLEMLKLSAISYTELTRDIWEHGKCVKINTETTPAQRHGVKPSTSFSVYAGPRSSVDGSFVGGTVTATLSGGSTIQPSGGKVRADAKYSYIAPADKEQTASIALESRSKRGVGKATLEFDTKGARGYLMEGGAAELRFKGQVCNLEERFLLRSEGELNDVKLIFNPESKDGGKYSYSGSMSGYDDKGKKYTFRVHGNGSYNVKYADDVATSIAARGPGTVETPYGPQNGSGSENYTLKPLGDQSCVGLAD